MWNWPTVPFRSSTPPASGYLAYLGISLALKEATRWFNKWRAGFFHWYREVYVVRMALLLLIGLIDYAVGALLLVPAWGGHG